MSLLADVNPNSVRDRLWIWGNEPKNQDASWNLPGISRMTAVEGALYLGVPNVVMVSHAGLPAPPLDRDAIAMRPLKRVVWSIVHSGGVTSGEETEHIFDIAARFPNFTGFILDDFFRRKEDGSWEASLTLDELRAIRERLTLPDRTLDLWAVHYTHQFDLPVEQHLALCDKLHFWTWHAAELPDLEDNFARLEQLCPDMPKVQGLYMWDFGERQPMPVDMMQHQCELGLKWLQEGRIEGMAFIASCVADLELDAVEWTREWIADVADSPIQTM